MFEKTESQRASEANALKHLSEDELADVLECARKVSSRDHAMLVVCFTHGLRNQEIARLRLTDLNWQNMEITCRRLKGSMETVQPLVKHRGRPALCEVTALKAWLRERRNNNSDLVFTSRKTDRPLTQRQINRIFTRYCQLASDARLNRREKPISKSVQHVHCLKHTRGTLLAERNVNPYRIKLILGHKSLSSTERYLHGSQKQAWAEAQRASMEMF
jgi:integrase/recombinase XerD